jgi:hypothetical protein
MKVNRTTEALPTWSLGYLINGDAANLTGDEIELLDRWQKEWGVEIVDPVITNEETHPYFSRTPLFGEPAEVMDCVVQYRNNV